MICTCFTLLVNSFSLRKCMTNPVGTQRVHFCGLFLKPFDCVPEIVQKPVIICPSKIKIKSARPNSQCQLSKLYNDSLNE